MMKKHMTNVLKKISMIIVALLLAFQSFLFLPADSSAATADIVRTGTASYGLSKVGTFTVNGDTAFCVQHDDTTTPSGAANYGENVYSNSDIRRAMYYGWKGPKNIFGDDRDRGYVVTSLVLSRLYTGEDAGGHSIPGYSELWSLAQTGHVPSVDLSFSDHTLSTHVEGDKQVSQSTTLKADPENSVTFNLPDGMHLYNETEGHSGIGQEVVKGGETFHLWANLDYNNNWSSGDVKGSMKPFQPLLVKVKNTSYQNLMRSGYLDPSLEDGINTNFYPRTVQMTIHHKDRQTNEELDTQTKTVTIGSYYEEHSRDDFWHNNIDEFEDGDQTANGTVPSNNYDVTFWYHTKWTLHAQYVDTHDGHVMWTEDTPNIWAGQWYDKWASTGEFDRDGHHYKETGNNHYTGNMPRGDVWLQFYFDEYNHARVTWKNQYPNNDVFQYKDDLIKVGDHYFYDQPATFTIWNGSIFDRNDDSVFQGNQPNWDIEHTFLYKLRRHVTVNYYDNRTGQKIKDSKEYDLHQGDHWDEDHPNITTNRHGKEYTYRYVRETGSAEHGTVGTDNVVINYYYDIPLIQAGVKKLQIYTAPSTQGLPVKVHLDKVNNYDYSIDDMSNKKISVSLYQGSTRYEEKQYTAKDLPTDLTFTIAKNLAINQNKPYTVKLENYDANDFDIISSERELTTQGYTSSEDTIEFDINSKASHEDTQKRVVMTEVEATKPMVTHYETFDYKAEPLKPEKTGYGTTADVQLAYESDLGEDYQTGTTVPKNTLNFDAPKELQDSYLNYPISGNTVAVPMDDQTSKDFFSGNDFFRTDKYEFPHVNIEKNTGNQFTDQQVENHDSKIKNTVIDGSHKFYSPIWGDLGNYHVDYTTNKMGVNRVTVKLMDSWKLYAHMFDHMDSTTKSQDAILLEPINASNPFPDGVPEGWTQSDINWVKN